MSEPIRLDLASLGDRFLGQLLDALVALALLITGLLLFAIFGPLATLAGIVFALFYLFFSDGFSAGQSYGKRMVATAVIGAESGLPCTFGQSFVRNLTLTVLGVFDWAFILGARRQRLGDRLAGTIVVKRPNPAGGWAARY